MLAGEPPHALALRAKHPRQRAAQLGVIELRGSSLVGTDYPDAEFLEFAQGARKIGYRDIGHGLGGAARDFRHHRRDAHRPVLGRDYRMHAKCIGNAQARAEVVRVLHAIEHQQQRRARQILEHRVQIVPWLGGEHPRRHTLMARMPGQPVETLCIHRNDAHCMTACQPYQILRPRIVARAVEIDLLHARGVLAQAAHHGVKAVDDMRISHSEIVVRGSWFVVRGSWFVVGGVRVGGQVFSSSTKSILLVSMSTRTSRTRTRSPIRKRLPVRSPSN